ncbi:MAG: polyprenyl synthetase family protein [Candidatus Cryptobacteroides sp.]
MDIALVREHLGDDWTAVVRTMHDALKSDIDLLDTTNGKILSHSGKQLRPMLALLVARACSCGKGTTEATVRYAAASELLHNATLLHDDVADESDRRRGVPTINSLMGPAVSVLVGDYWLVKAMDLIIGDSGADTRVIKIFSKTLSDLAEGEMLQLQKAMSGDTVEEDYRRIIYCKTASLFEAACISAAVSVGASPQFEKAAADYAVALGLAFQVKDDILDYDGGEAVGKPLGVDIAEQKITAPLLGAFSQVDVQQERRVRQMVKDIVGNPASRDEIITFVKENGGLDRAEQMLDSYIREAVAALDVLPDSFEKTTLVQLAHFVADRNS